MDTPGSYTLTLNISFDCNAYPFASNFDTGYEQTCIINSSNLSPNPFINLNLSALEIGSSGGVGILRDNYLNFYSQVRDKSEREKRTLLPTELLTNSFNTIKRFPINKDENFDIVITGIDDVYAVWSDSTDWIGAFETLGEAEEFITNNLL
jgi:hypothetical protein